MLSKSATGFIKKRYDVALVLKNNRMKLKDIFLKNIFRYSLKYPQKIRTGKNFSGRVWTGSRARRGRVKRLPKKPLGLFFHFSPFPSMISGTSPVH
jgi:hypothetical protein